MTDQDRADLIRAARYLEENNDEDSTITVREAERIAATLRRVQARRKTALKRVEGALLYLRRELSARGVDLSDGAKR